MLYHVVNPLVSTCVPQALFTLLFSQISEDGFEMHMVYSYFL